jgi:hypothetical protein
MNIANCFLRYFVIIVIHFILYEVMSNIYYSFCYEWWLFIMRNFRTIYARCRHTWHKSTATPCKTVYGSYKYYKGRVFWAGQGKMIYTQQTTQRDVRPQSNGSHLQILIPCKREQVSRDATWKLQMNPVDWKGHGSLQPDNKGRRRTAFILLVVRACWYVR